MMGGGGVKGKELNKATPKTPGFPPKMAILPIKKYL